MAWSCFPTHGVYLGDARFERVFAELERRGAVAAVHPTTSPDSSAHHLGLPDSLIDFTADTTWAVTQMQYSNGFTRTRKALGSTSSSPTSILIGVRYTWRLQDANLNVVVHVWGGKVKALSP